MAPKVVIASTLAKFVRPLLLLLLFTAVATNQRASSSKISLNSELSASKHPTYWSSDSGRFAFGFYPEQGGFRVGIWLQTKPNKTVVWTANRDDPPVPADSRLVLRDGDGLVLSSGQIQTAKTLTRVSESVSSASFLDTGNFVLYGFFNTSKRIWESFDFPTDTILAGQDLLNEDVELVSSVSGSNHSSGRFRLIHQFDGNLVLYPVETPTNGDNAYWASDSNALGGEVPQRLSLANNGSLLIVNNYNASDVVFKMSATTNLYSSDVAREELMYRATMDADGFFRLYSHDFASGEYGRSTMVKKWPITEDPCGVKGICGLNSYCGRSSSSAAPAGTGVRSHLCYCPSGFRLADPDNRSGGCVRNFTGKCAGVVTESIDLLENVGWLDNFYSVPSASTQQECASLCLGDPYCEAAYFEEDKCWKQILPLRYGKVVNGTRSATLVKISTCHGSINVTQIVYISEKPSHRRGINSVILGVAISTTLAVALLCLVAAVLVCHRSRTRRRRLLLGGVNIEQGDASLRSFSYTELARATHGFKEELGKGAFGAVYKGLLLPSNTVGREKAIAVKRLEKLVGEGEREFLSEIRSIGRTHHRNLVRLLGVCSEAQTRLLVYDYMSNGSLDQYLFNAAKRRLGWNERVRIALDVARGILYLHEYCEPHIIHCDIKPQNILIDDSWTAKISDFGLAKLLTPDQTKTFTDVRGTRGYLAPEWYKNATVSVKADVYSFGVVLLEIICCRRNLEVDDVPEDEIILSDWVYKCFRTGQLVKILKREEQEEEGEVDKRRLERMVYVALWCIQDEPALRPPIKSVVSMLEGSSEVPLPPIPTS
ncbi:hypothetical protein H6P81_008636 [Aristolochia fimbriata]|uniref:Receptor-like serine/threonine-protein kinase n=1 Tax=Aristolochia fimbriata TaxID=158543 RepID=A0AAV7EJV2_ARIFI|nr:hypothetical protein H6P81_008636 [Aristolochia fimbriata]